MLGFGDGAAQLSRCQEDRIAGAAGTVDPLNCRVLMLVDSVGLSACGQSGVASSITIGPPITLDREQSLAEGDILYR
jgi:hypothetical protein